VYAKDFLIVPRFVFFALQKWYGCNSVIERKVISCQKDKKKAINDFKQKRSQSNTVLLAEQIPSLFYKTIGETNYELDVYPKFMYFQRINDKGEKPHQKAIVNRKIDASYIKKN
jgi:hypothetical protein